jgi:hypothetical protein
VVAGAGGEFFSLGPEEVAIAFGAPAPQSRAKVAFRAVLAIPQLIALAVFGLVASVLAVIGWFAALGLGRLPRWIAVYETGWLAYQTRVKAYLYLMLDDYPPFEIGPADYPIRVDIGASLLSRFKVLFRLLL